MMRKDSQWYKMLVRNVFRALSDPFIEWGLLFLRQCQHPHARLRSRYISRDVRLGKGVMIGRGSEIGAGSRIGDYSYVNSFTCIRYAIIGKFTSISYMCAIGLQEHPTHLLSTSSHIYGNRNLLGCPCLHDDVSAPTMIGNDVWIGAQVFIRQGVTVG